ncbi:MAG: hypothetical protein ABSE95_15120 [Thermodesulfobacteriota bacterium]
MLIEVGIFKVGRRTPWKAGEDFKDLLAAETAKMEILFSLLSPQTGISNRESA